MRADWCARTKHFDDGWSDGIVESESRGEFEFQKMRQRESADWSSNQALQATPESAGLVALSRRPGVPELFRSTAT